MEETTTKDRTQNSRLRRVEGKHNALVKELRGAFTGELTPDGYCAIEGLRILEEAIRSGLRFRAVFFNESAALRADRLLSQLGAQVETLLLPDKLFASIVPSEAPQGAAATGPRTRPVYFSGVGACEAAVRRFEAIRPGERIVGPAIIESSFTSVVINPGATAERRASGSLSIDPGRG